MAPHFLLLALCSLFLAQSARAQGGTTLGKSQNTSDDLINSLVPGPKRFDKGEKKSEVDPKTLPSKKINDKTFSGSLNDIGLDWNGDGMGKPHAAGGSQGANLAAGGHEPVAKGSREGEDSVSGQPSGAEFKNSKSADAGKDPKAAAKQPDTAGDKEKVLKQADAAGENQNKKQKTASDSDAEKASASSTDKSSPTKPEGDR